MLMDIRQKGWLWVENDLVDREDLTIYEKMVYITLVKFSDRCNLCFPSYKTIAKKVGCSIRKAKETIKSLEEKELIIKQNRIKESKAGNLNESNIYFIKSCSSSFESSKEENKEKLHSEIDYVDVQEKEEVILDINLSKENSKERAKEINKVVEEDNRKVADEVEHLIEKYEDEIINSESKNELEKNFEVVHDLHRSSAQDAPGVVHDMHQGSAQDALGVVHEVHPNNTHRNNTQLTSNNIYSLVITYLNQKAGTKYKHTTRKTQGFIKARVQEGFTEKDFYLVIDKKVSEWNNTEFSKYLRPETLFGNKFEGYLNQGVKDYGKCRGNGSFGSNNEKHKGEQGKFTGYRPPKPVHDGAGDEDTTELI